VVSHARDVAADKALEKRNNLVLEHLPLVKAIAAQCRSKLPTHLEFSDLVQAGIVGLLDASFKYDSDAETAFSTYATYRIRGAILDSLRELDPVPRKVRRRSKELDQIRRGLTQELQRSPTEAEVSDKSGIDLESLRNTTLSIYNLQQMSCSSGPCRAGSGEPRSHGLDEPESVLEGMERKQVLRELIGRLPESFRMILALHYSKDLTLREISGKAGLPERQISRIHKRALERINAMLLAKGIRAMAEI